jgi:hypothetical protein
MILKIKSMHGWVMVPNIDYAEYGDIGSKKAGFYKVEVQGRKILVPVIKPNLPDEDLYYPNDDMVIIKSPNHGSTTEKVRVNGRSKFEVARDDNDDDIHNEFVKFMSWLRDGLGNVYLFDEAYLLNDQGDTIEHIL